MEYNNQHPFWAFANSMNEQAARGQHEGGGEPDWQAPFGWGFPFGPMPNRGRHGPPGPHGPHGRRPDGPHGHHHDGPPHHGHGGPRGRSPPPPHPPADAEDPPSRAPTPPTPPEDTDEHQPRSDDPLSGPHHGPAGRHHRGGHHGGPSGRGRCGRGPRHHEHSHGPHGRGFGGPRGPPGFGNPQFWQSIDWPRLAQQFMGGNADFFREAFQPGQQQQRNNDGDESFQPEVDVFDTSSAYVIHAALPGAKKSDMDVSFDAGSNGVKISGVVQRPGEVDEEMLSALVEGGRRVGLFEKLVRLDKEVKVDADRLSAKLEDGVLRIEVPKILEEEEEWTEVKRVTIE